LVLRYPAGPAGEAVDGLPGREGAFLACSFWLADNYALVGRTNDAQRLFGRLLGLRNDVGLLAEEYDPVAGRQLGNFPRPSPMSPWSTPPCTSPRPAPTHAIYASRTRARTRQGDHDHWTPPARAALGPSSTGGARQA
jgi:hypothetical protein